MPVRDCRFDGSRKLNIKDAPTGAGDERAHKQELEARMPENSGITVEMMGEAESYVV